MAQSFYVTMRVCLFVCLCIVCVCARARVVCVFVSVKHCVYPLPVSVIFISRYFVIASVCSVSVWYVYMYYVYMCYMRVRGRALAYPYVCFCLFTIGWD